MSVRFFRPLVVSGFLFASQLLHAVALNVPPPPAIAARAYILTDFHSGTTLASLDADKRVDPASLTKLMTAYITFGALKDGRLKIDQTLTVSEHAWKAEGSRMFINVNTAVPVSELIRGMIVVSGNDASITLAEGIGGSEDSFANLMNAMAAKLGMKNTHYMNATGLPNLQHYTTARDLSILAAAIIRDFPAYFPIYSMKEYTHNGIKQPNRNLLLWRDPGVDGMKTGHTDAAGFCLTSTLHRGDRRVIAVVLGTASDQVRATESLKLLNYGIQFFDTPKIYAKGKTLQPIQVWKGEHNSVSVGFNQDVFLTVPKGAGNRVKAQLVSQSPLLAPIAGGQVVGKVVFTLDGKAFGETPAVALQPVNRAGFFGRAWDGMKLWFH